MMESIEVYDAGDGIVLKIPLGIGFYEIMLTDECADGLCKTIRNKLNGRFRM